MDATTIALDRLCRNHLSVVLSGDPIGSLLQTDRPRRPGHQQRQQASNQQSAQEFDHEAEFPMKSKASLGDEA